MLAERRRLHSLAELQSGPALARSRRNERGRRRVAGVRHLGHQPGESRTLGVTFPLTPPLLGVVGAAAGAEDALISYELRLARQLARLGRRKTRLGGERCRRRLVVVVARVVGAGVDAGRVVVARYRLRQVPDVRPVTTTDALTPIFARHQVLVAAVAVRTRGRCRTRTGVPRTRGFRLLLSTSGSLKITRITHVRSLL